MQNLELEYEIDDHIRRYRLCRAGFALIAFGVLLRAIDVGMHVGLMMSIFDRNRLFFDAINHPLYGWVIKTPLTAALLLGPYVLWNRWPEPSWQRRTGALVTLGLIDAFLWVLDNERTFGLDLGGEGHKWLRLHVARAISWAQLYLGAAVAADFLDHLGRHREAKAAGTVRGFLAAGVSIWALYFVQQTVWAAGWPLQQRGLNLMMIVLLVAYLLPLSVAAVQVMALCLISHREASRLTADLIRHQ